MRSLVVTLACALWYACATEPRYYYIYDRKHESLTKVRCEDLSSQNWTDYGALGNWYIGKAWPDTSLTNSSVVIRSAEAVEVDRWKRMKGNNWTETNGFDTRKTLIMTVTPQKKGNEEVDVRTVMLTPRIALAGGYRAVLASNVGTGEERAVGKFDLVFNYVDSYLVFMDCANAKLFLLSRTALRDDGEDGTWEPGNFLGFRNVNGHNSLSIIKIPNKVPA